MCVCVRFVFVKFEFFFLQIHRHPSIVTHMTTFIVFGWYISFPHNHQINKHKGKIQMFLFGFFFVRRSLRPYYTTFTSHRLLVFGMGTKIVHSFFFCVCVFACMIDKWKKKWEKSFIWFIMQNIIEFTFIHPLLLLLLLSCDNNNIDLTRCVFFSFWSNYSLSFFKRFLLLTVCCVCVCLCLCNILAHLTTFYLYILFFSCLICFL